MFSGNFNNLWNSKMYEMQNNYIGLSLKKMTFRINGYQNCSTNRYFNV